MGMRRVLEQETRAIATFFCMISICQRIMCWTVQGSDSEIEDFMICQSISSSKCGIQGLAT